MTKKDFWALDEMEQAESVWAGRHIGDRQDEEHNISLYKLEGIYVEVFYHREYNVLRKFIAYANQDELLPFLGQYNNL
jgi:hypothetical protein